MSQIEHRKRLREQQERERAGSGGLAAFQASTTNTVVNAAKPTAAVSVAPVEAPPPERIAEPSVYQPGPTAEPVIVPVGQQSMTPSEMRKHARQTAELFAQLPTAEYQASLQSLESNNPTLYSIVVDELNNIAAAGDGEGDGFDLSGVASGAAGHYPNADATPDVAE